MKCFFAAENNELASLDDAFRFCDEESICRRVAADFFPRVTGYVALDQLDSTPLLTFTGAPGDDALLLAKRAMDIVLSAAGLILLSPIFLLVAVLVKLPRAVDDLPSGTLRTQRPHLHLLQVPHHGSRR